MTSSWYGISRSGEHRQVSHSALMNWARRNDLTYSVGWGDRIEMPDGTRLVRAADVKSLPDVARSAGWDDLAAALSQWLQTS